MPTKNAEKIARLLSSSTPEHVSQGLELAHALGGSVHDKAVAR